MTDERTSELSSAFTIGKWMVYVDQAETKKKKDLIPLAEERSSKGI